MSIPASIIAEITALDTATAAAAPLSGAPRVTVLGLQNSAAQLVTDVNTALGEAAGALDTFEAPVDPAAIVSGIKALICSAEDQSDLATMAGFVGRVASNLNQLS